MLPRLDSNQDEMVNSHLCSPITSQGNNIRRGGSQRVLAPSPRPDETTVPRRTGFVKTQRGKTLKLVIQGVEISLQVSITEAERIVSVSGNPVWCKSHPCFLDIMAKEVNRSWLERSPCYDIENSGF
jgi:hypothetical protein